MNRQRADVRQLHQMRQWPVGILRQIELRLQLLRHRTAPRRDSVDGTASSRRASSCSEACSSETHEPLPSTCSATGEPVSGGAEFERSTANRSIRTAGQ